MLTQSFELKKVVPFVEELSRCGFFWKISPCAWMSPEPLKRWAQHAGLGAYNSERFAARL
jgi:hypothetical protein